MPQSNRIEKFQMISNLLTGSNIDREDTDKLSYKDPFGEHFSGSEFTVANRINPIKKDTKKLKIKFSNNFSAQPTDKIYYNQASEKDIKELTDRIFGKGQYNSGNTNRFSIILPFSGSGISSTNENISEFETNWTHHHVKPFEEASKEQKENYCQRLYSAFALLTNLTEKTTNKKSSILNSIINTFTVSDYFYAFDKEDVEKLVEEYKKYINSFDEGRNKKNNRKKQDTFPYSDCKKLLENPERLEKLMRNDRKYYIFAGQEKKIDTRKLIKEKYYAQDYLLDLKAPISKTPLDTIFNKVVIRSGTQANPDLSESDQQHILLGLAYTLSIFSGEIITIELPLRNRAGREEKAYQVYKNPVIMAPEPITDMFQDLKKHHQRLDTIIKLSTSKRHSPLDLSKIKFNSAYTVHLLINHTRLNSGDFDSLMKIIGHFKKGCEPEELIRMLKVSNKIVVKNNYYNNVMPRKAVTLPSLL